MKNTIMGIKLSDWTVKRISMALKDTKKDKDSWFAGYSTARAEMEISNEYRNGNITAAEFEIISAFVRNITIRYSSKNRESIYTHEYRHKTHL